MTDGTSDRRSTAEPHAFVSCDIVGHSGESELERQSEHVASINRIVQEAIAAGGDETVVWASGGDGGHVAFGGAAPAAGALALIVALRRWSSASGVPLRVVASHGEVARVTGADGRTQLVGHGINFAGRLLRYGGPETVLVTTRFRELVESAGVEGARFSDEAVVELPYFGTQEVWLLSIDDAFESAGVAHGSVDDRAGLRAALGRQDAMLEALYGAKRLLQIDPNDRDARDALGVLADRRTLVADGADVAALILDPDFGTDFIRSAQLVERRQGDLVCRNGDEGTTMFLVLRGELGGFTGSEQPASHRIATPEFRFAPGALVGELAFALRRPRTATIWCLQDTALLAFSHQELVDSARDPEVRRQLEEAVNRTIRPRIVEHVGRTAPYLAGPGGPLDDAEATWARLRRSSRILSFRWREDPVLKPDGEPVRGNGLYILVGGTLESASGRLLHDVDQPLVYVDVPGHVVWRDEEYTLDDDVTLLAVQADVLEEFGARTFRELVARLRREVGRAGGRESTPVAAAPQAGKPAAGARGHVFVSYSHKDRIWLDRLKTHIEPSHRDGRLELWDDTSILPGGKWREEIEAALAAASVAVLLVSPDFLESRFIAEQELPPLLRAAAERGLTILWIPITYSRYEVTAIADYQAVHPPDRPLRSLGPAARDKALVAIAKEIDRAVARAAGS